jgi:hypothetical protein
MQKVIAPESSAPNGGSNEPHIEADAPKAPVPGPVAANGTELAPAPAGIPLETVPAPEKLAPEPQPADKPATDEVKEAKESSEEAKKDVNEDTPMEDAPPVNEASKKTPVVEKVKEVANEVKESVKGLVHAPSTGDASKTESNPSVEKPAAPTNGNSTAAKPQDAQSSGEPPASIPSGSLSAAAVTATLPPHSPVTGDETGTHPVTGGETGTHLAPRLPPPSGELSITAASEASSGTKRLAGESSGSNGASAADDASEPTAKKAKIKETANGAPVSRKGSKRERKQPAPVGRTERRTRSQGPLV